MITKHPTWNSVKKSLLFHYLTFHYLEIHETYPEFIPVQDISYSDILKENEKLNPRNRIQLPEIKSKQKVFSLEELFIKLNEMLNC
jgi:hypothetical protein